ncbi:sterol desaturase family protein [Phenylobacterium sp. LjRoot225]|uniref:sterol desaturase family protein n=1 Tax=Phenylobacterium sp. LjRoot225 TaxID=3342285 RepID=UPI003ECE20C4
MSTPFFASLLEHYQWQLSLYAAVGIFALTFLGKRLLLLVPTFKEADQLNQAALKKKMERPIYAANQKWNRKWGFIYMAVIFGLILPFCLTLQAQPWWRILLDIVVILMFYDFFYYLVHRFLFHDNGFLGGPLVRVHALHHQQHNPCRMDSSYIHPLEVAMGLGLYAGSIFVLSHFMGEFHVATVVITWVAFSQINLHNHDLWKADRFPFRYLNYTSKMHHNHHAKFTGGNFATISLLYDWMFGTLDNGEDRKKRVKA